MGGPRSASQIWVLHFFFQENCFLFKKKTVIDEKEKAVCKYHQLYALSAQMFTFFSCNPENAPDYLSSSVTKVASAPPLHTVVLNFNVLKAIYLAGGQPVLFFLSLAADQQTTKKKRSAPLR